MSRAAFFERLALLGTQRLKLLARCLRSCVCDGGTISLGQDLVAPAQALRRRGDRPERQDSPDLIEALTA